MSAKSPAKRVRRTRATGADPRRETGERRRQHLYASVCTAVRGRISDEEVDIHFALMPARYWARVNADSVVRHLEIIHAFMTGLHAPEADGTAPIVRWQHFPKRRVTAVEICTWDRLGLLAKIAGALARVGLNIVRADIYTRGDDVVLDVFEINDASGRHVADESRLAEMTRILTAALRPDSVEPLGTSTPNDRTPTESVAPHVRLSAESPEYSTKLEIETADRVGLLYDVFSALTASGVNVVHAIITTEHGRAGDVFFLTDPEGAPITDRATLEQIRQRVLATLD